MDHLSVISIVGLIIAAYAGVIFLIVAFKESVLWGVLCLLPVFPLVFLLAHWDEAKKPFFVSFFGWLIFFAGWRYQ